MSSLETTADRRHWLFAGLNLAQAMLLGAILLWLPSNAMWVNLTLGVGLALMLASSPALVFGGQRGQWVAAAACLYQWVLGTVFALGTASSAAYLYGIYGNFGKSLGLVSGAGTFCVLIVFWLIPAHELSWLRSRR